jgi:NodT family efflux transporter outer membrane factor (OMF) lipoprotein
MGQAAGLGDAARFWRGLAVAGLTALALAACAVADDEDRQIPQQPLPATFRNSGADQTALPPPQSEWWKEFRHPELTRLIERAMENNHDIRVAATRIAQAEAQAAVTGALQFPTLDFVPKWGLNAPLGGAGSANDHLTKWESQRMHQLSLKTAYEVDLWGKNAYAAESAIALAQASVHYREVVSMTLAADVAKTYFDYLSESDRINVAERNVANTRAALAGLNARMERGDATITDVSQQETAVANAEATIPVHILNREKALNKLAALLGTTPADLLPLDGYSLVGLEPPRIGTGLPAQLICRRPDIRRAEANLLAANADIKVARARMYPSFTFSGEGGWAAYTLPSLIQPQALYYNFASQIAASIFDAGRNAAGVLQNRARYEEMVETYRQVILESVHDVEDALAAIRQIGEQQASLARAAKSARRAFETSTKAYDRGVVDFLTLLETQRTLFSTEDAETAARADRLKAAVDLFKALGGGFDEPQC